MTREAIALLKSVDGEAVPLRGVSAQGRLTGLLFELTVEQRYENSGGENIEAVFTFPVPSRAVLLGLTFAIGQRTLEAVAVRKADASRRYEKAIDEGDTAVLLEQAGDGLYTVSLGNLQAGETASIRYRYAELLDRHRDQVRVCVPTVIAPRYGDPAAHGLEAHQAPGVNALAEYPFELMVDLDGPIATAEIGSPSHRIAIVAREGGRRVTLAGTAFLDRDFVLTLQGAMTGNSSVVVPDGEEFVALVSLDPGLPEPVASPVALKVLVDCSGSMGGSSIAVARRGLRAALDRLTSRDRVSLTRFGSRVAPVTEGLLSANDVVLARLRHEATQLQADLGGTELPGALAHVIAIPVGDARADMLLITDAEVWAVERVLRSVAQAGHRLFVLAVGSAPAEALARRVAEVTGGACEFVTPAEDVVAAAARLMARMREAPKTIANVAWPAEPLWQAPLPPAVFGGDTLHLLAGFARAPAGDVRVSICGPGTPDIGLRATLESPGIGDVLPRLAASRRLVALGADAAADLAERHRLVSEHTSLVVVDARAGKAQALPRLRPVPQMLAAGWGATADIECGEYYRQSMTLVCLDPSVPETENGYTRYFQTEVPANYRTDRPPVGPKRRLPPQVPVGEGSPAALLAAVRAAIGAGATLPTTVSELRALGLPGWLADALDRAASRQYATQSVDLWDDDAGDAERAIVRLFIALLADIPVPVPLSPAERGALQGKLLGDRSFRELRGSLAHLLNRATAEHWGGQHTAA